MRERDVERILIREVKRRGGLCLKFVSPGWDGAPDRIVLLPGGKLCFVEVKRPGGKPRPLQEARLRQLGKMGFQTYILDEPERIPDLLDFLITDGGGVFVKP